MSSLRQLFRRWQIEHDERQRFHFEQTDVRSRAMLGAYGLDERQSGGSSRR